MLSIFINWVESMDVNKSLQSILSQFPNVKLDKLEYAQITADNIDYVQLGRLMSETGRVLQLDENTKSYVVAVRESSNALNEGVVALRMVDNTVFIAAYAQEGLIKQHTAEKIIQRLTGIINS